MGETQKSKSWKVIYNAPRELQLRERLKVVAYAEELATENLYSGEGKNE